MITHSSSRIGNVSSRKAKIISVTLVLSMLLGLVLMRSGMAQSLPSIKIEPKYYTAKVGDRFDVPIYVHGATYPTSDVYAWQVQIEWTASALEMYTPVQYSTFMSAPRYGIWGVLTQDAPSGQRAVTVTDSTKYAVGSSVFVRDDSHNQNNTVQSIAGNTLTLTTILAYTYTVAANAGCYPIPTLTTAINLNNAMGYCKFGPTTLGDETPGAQGDGLLATVTFYVEQDVPAVLNITNTFTYIVNSQLQAVGDDPGELDKQNGYKNWNEDITGNGIVSANDLYWIGKDFNKRPIQTRHPTVTTPLTGGWNASGSGYTPNGTSTTCAYAVNNGKTQVYKTFNFATTGLTTITKVEVGLYVRRVGGTSKVNVEVSNNGGASWSAATAVTPTSTWTLYWLDFTAAFAWDSTMIGNIAVRITFVWVSGTGTQTIYVDWIPVRVTPSPLSTSSYSDVNKDGVVNTADLTPLASKFGQQYGT
jgi:hypothetical protein